jgi:hypothetical protein
VGCARNKWSGQTNKQTNKLYSSTGPGYLSIPIRFYYRIRELNFYLPGLPQELNNFQITTGWRNFWCDQWTDALLPSKFTGTHCLKFEMDGKRRIVDSSVSCCQQYVISWKSGQWLPAVIYLFHCHQYVK